MNVYLSRKRRVEMIGIYLAPTGVTNAISGPSLGTVQYSDIKKRNKTKIRNDVRLSMEANPVQREAAGVGAEENEIQSYTLIGWESGRNEGNTMTNRKLGRKSTEE
jgi:hypothetical protein